MSASVACNGQNALLHSANQIEFDLTIIPLAPFSQADMVKNMASDVYLFRKDRRWQKFSKIDEIVLTGDSEPDMNVWSSEYRDLFDVDTSLFSAPGSLTVTLPSNPGESTTITSVTSEKLQFKAGLIPTEPLNQQTVSGTYTSTIGSRSYGTNTSVVPTGVTSTTSDEVSHADLRQSVLKKTHWRFRQANSATPTYLYATWADGDQISNNPPETI